MAKHSASLMFFKIVSNCLKRSHDGKETMTKMTKSYLKILKTVMIILWVMSFVVILKSL